MRLWLMILGLAIVRMAVGLSAVQGQGPGAGASIAFRNDTKSAVIVQGVSSVGGMIRRGQPVVVAPGRQGVDFNIPSGPRLYSVYDASQPTRVLARDVPVTAPATGYLMFSVRTLPNNQVVLVPDAK